MIWRSICTLYGTSICGDSARTAAEPLRGSCSQTHNLRTLHRVSSPTRHIVTNGVPVKMPLFKSKKRRVVRSFDIYFNQIIKRPYRSASNRLCFKQSGTQRNSPGPCLRGNHDPYSYIGSKRVALQWVKARKLRYPRRTLWL